MVTTGFSMPYVAKYANTGTTVTYTSGMDLARGVSLSLEIDTADDNNFLCQQCSGRGGNGTVYKRICDSYGRWSLK